MGSTFMLWTRNTVNMGSTIMLLLGMVERMLPPKTTHPLDSRATGSAAGGDGKEDEGGAEGKAAAP